MSSPAAGDPGSREAAAWDAVWELSPGELSPVRHPGDRQLQESVAAIIRGAALDAFALSEGARTALVIGCGEGWIAQRLLSWGADWVVGLDTRESAIARGRTLGERSGLDSRRLRLQVTGDLAAPPPPAEDRQWRSPRYSIVVVTPAAEAPAAERLPILANAVAAADHRVAVETAERERSIHDLREVGLRPLPSLIPLDAERRLILRERAVLIGAPEHRP